MPTTVELKSGLRLRIRRATESDVPVIAEEHPLPRGPDAPERPLRTYYRAKTWLNVTTRGAGVVTGWVEDRLAGFVFYAASQSRLKQSARSMKTIRWLVGRLVRGELGWNPRLWLQCVAWARQHFRQTARGSGDDGPTSQQPLPPFEAWIGTVHTVSEFRRLGVASALLDEAEESLRSEGAEEAALWAAVGNEAALALYEKRGYAKVDRAVRIGEECWLMRKLLDDHSPGT